MSDAAYTPASTAAATPETFTDDPKPVRLSFKPWGRRRVGDADPEAPSYQRLDGHAYYTRRDATSGSEIVRYEDITGREFILAPGENFVHADAGDFPDDVARDLSLSEYDLVVGRRRADGAGYIPVGVNPVMLLPDSGGDEA